MKLSPEAIAWLDLIQQMTLERHAPPDAPRLRRQCRALRRRDHLRRLRIF